MPLILNPAHVNAVQSTLSHLSNIGGGGCVISLRGSENTVVSARVVARGDVFIVEITQYDETVVIAAEKYTSFSAFTQQYGKH